MIIYSTKDILKREKGIFLFKLLKNIFTEFAYISLNSALNSIVWARMKSYVSYLFIRAHIIEFRALLREL